MKKTKTNLYIDDSLKRIEVYTEEEFKALQTPNKKYDFLVFVALIISLIAIIVNLIVLFI